MAFNFTQTRDKMQKTLDHVQRDISSLRTGKASSQLLDPVMVEAYGAKMKIAELATVQAPDPSMIVVSPWDKSILANIEKAIATADLNLNPVVDGDIIRIKIAPLTEEKRKEMVKVLHKKIESGKVMLRNIRTDSKKEVEGQKGTDGISEDDIKADLQNLDIILKEFMEKLEVIASEKETDLLTI